MQDFQHYLPRMIWSWGMVGYPAAGLLCQQLDNTFLLAVLFYHYQPHSIQSNSPPLATVSSSISLFHSHAPSLIWAYNGTVMGATHEDHPVNSWSPVWSEALGLPQGPV
ncbi:hypothetical protein BT96DRAFT_1001307 [Gymnopus androsaceus JB14]|uniref:Uncharacterized protein n=1 Tax=Gymnopus androsaceus JB14 TaxID=1447944 RepID=A0A6A4H185_9AGAR|nr:hypothetical protein BT96DRAFT_1001307 [Gymnopus androsaceus JB14]